MLDATGGPATKQVHYWSARVTGGTGTLEHEIDEVAWVDVRTAHDRLDYARDREQLLALVRADRSDELRTWPIAFVRHAKAIPRGKWSGDDRRRPLDAVGRAQATTVSAVLGAYGVKRLVSSSSTRCVATVESYAVARGLRLRTRDALSEEGFAESQEGAVAQVRRLLERGDPAAVCSHGPVLPTLLRILHTRVAQSPERAGSWPSTCALPRTSRWPRERCSSATSSGGATTRASSTSSASTPDARTVVGTVRVRSEPFIVGRSGPLRIPGGTPPQDVAPR